MAKIFLNPVNIKEVPDYYKYIKHPMDLRKVEKKLIKGHYKAVFSFF